MTKIILSNEVFAYLEAVTAGVHGKEFSGMGFVTRQDDDLHVYDVEVLHVGSEVLTEINAKRIYTLTQRKDRQRMRLWFHRHPVGDGVPGLHNWSSTDHNQIITSPLGGIPELVKWSCSIVRTPKGWVGRVDDHLQKQTVHVEVLPAVHSKILAAEWESMYQAYLRSISPPTFRRGYFDDFPVESKNYKRTTGAKRLLDLEACEVCGHKSTIIETCGECGKKVCVSHYNYIKGVPVCRSCQPELLKKEEKKKWKLFG